MIYYLSLPAVNCGGFSCPILFSTAEPGILDFRFWHLPVNGGATFLARDTSFLVYRLRNCSTGHLIRFKKLHVEVSRMKVSRRLVSDQRGQGLIEYTLIMVLVVLVFWVTIKETDIGPAIADQWSKIIVCLDTPFTCTPPA
jgi:Flp pilus assembly pilin Flp